MFPSRPASNKLRCASALVNLLQGGSVQSQHSPLALRPHYTAVACMPVLLSQTQPTFTKRCRLERTQEAHVQRHNIAGKAGRVSNSQAAVLQNAHAPGGVEGRVVQRDAPAVVRKVVCHSHHAGLRVNGQKPLAWAC